MGVNWITKKDIKNEVRKIIGEDGFDDDLLNGFIRDGHRQLEYEDDWEWLLQIDYQTRVTQGQSIITLPDNFRMFNFKESKYESPYLIYDTATKLWPITEKEYQNKYANDLTQDGVPQNFRFTDETVGVKNQPKGPSPVTVKSTSILDNQTGLIRGKYQGFELYESVTLKGVTEISSINLYDEITSFSLDALPNGNVYVLSDKGATLNAVLNPGESAKRYKIIRLIPVPNPAEDCKLLRFSFYQYIPDLVQDLDVSIIPNPVYLSAYCRMRAYETQEDFANIKTAELLVQSAVSQMKSNKINRKFKNQATVQKFMHTRGV